MGKILTRDCSLTTHGAPKHRNLLRLGRMDVLHHRRNASSRLLLLISKHLILCIYLVLRILFFFSSRRRHTSSLCDWSSDVCSSDLQPRVTYGGGLADRRKGGRKNGAGARGLAEIGRASCRERVARSEGCVS